jgi:membrane protease YdiL (CAAX protease family)
MDPLAPSPGARRGEPTWGIPDALVGWLVAFTSSALIGSMVMLAFGYGGADGTPLEDAPMTLLALAQYPPLWFGMVGVPLFVSRLKGNGVIEDFKLRVQASDLVGIPIGIATQLVVVPLVSYPVLWLSGTSVDDLSEPARELADKAQASSTIGILLFVAVVVIGAPIAEEIFFRGLALRAFAKRWGPAVGLLASSVLFGLTHFQPLQFPALVAAGAIFGWLALRYDRLGPAIFCHLAFNATTVVNILWLQ